MLYVQTHTPFPPFYYKYYRRYSSVPPEHAVMMDDGCWMVLFSCWLVLVVGFMLWLVAVVQPSFRFPILFPPFFLFLNV